MTTEGASSKGTAGQESGPVNVTRARCYRHLQIGPSSHLPSSQNSHQMPHTRLLEWPTRAHQKIVHWSALPLNQKHGWSHDSMQEGRILSWGSELIAPMPRRQNGGHQKRMQGKTELAVNIPLQYNTMSPYNAGAFSNFNYHQDIPEHKTVGVITLALLPIPSLHLTYAPGGAARPWASGGGRAESAGRARGKASRCRLRTRAGDTERSAVQQPVSCGNAQC